MSRFVQKPNLPSSDVVLAAAGEKYLRLINYGASKLGIELLTIPENVYLDSRLSGHADLSFLHTGYNSVFASSQVMSFGLLTRLESEGFEVLEPQCCPGDVYPYDCKLNVCIADKYYICNENIIDTEIKNRLSDNDLVPVYVNQGYSKCSVCLVDSTSAITSDRGIASSLKLYGFDVLLIETGGIILEGFDYGFIGGSAFMAGKDRICFTGDFRFFDGLTEKKIMAFLEEREINHSFLTDGPIIDMGGIIQLKEKEN